MKLSIPLTNLLFYGRSCIMHRSHGIGVARRSPNGRVHSTWSSCPIPLFRHCDPQAIAYIRYAMTEGKGRLENGKITVIAAAFMTNARDDR